MPMLADAHISSLGYLWLTPLLIGLSDIQVDNC